MDTARWPQEIVMKPLEEIVPSNNNLSNSSSLERKVRPQKEEAVNCPRCNSTNTKFCYYNNYSLSQPRFFCKSCKRYWTQGGSLRNIPVGGASRAKNKRSSSSSSSKKLPDHLVLPNSIATTTNNTPAPAGAGAATNNSHHHQSPKIHQGQDLNLGFPTHDLKTISQLIQVPNFDHNSSSSAMELLNGISSRGYLMNSFMPMPVSDPSSMYSSGFSLQDLKPNLNFSLDHTSTMGGNHHSGGGGGYGDLHHHHHHHHQEVQEDDNNNNSSGKLLQFPFEDLKQVSGPSDTSSMDQQQQQQQQNRDQQQQGDSTGYWNGVLGSGSW